MLPKRNEMPQHLKDLAVFLKEKGHANSAIDSILHKLLKENWKPETLETDGVGMANQRYTFKIQTISNTYAIGKFDSISEFGETERYHILGKACELSEDVRKHMISAQFSHTNQTDENTIWLEFGEMPKRKVVENYILSGDLSGFKL